MTHKLAFARKKSEFQDLKKVAVSFDLWGYQLRVQGKKELKSRNS